MQQASEERVAVTTSVSGTTVSSKQNIGFTKDGLVDDSVVLAVESLVLESDLTR